MKVYAIRHKPSGRFMPYRRNSRGASYDEPTADMAKGEMPRLFPTQDSARRTLVAWLQGIWKDEYYDTIDGPDYTGPAPTKQPDRKKDDMEIIILTLAIRKVFRT